MSDNIQPVTFKPCGPYKVTMTLVGTAVRLQDDAQVSVNCSGLTVARD